MAKIVDILTNKKFRREPRLTLMRDTRKALILKGVTPTRAKAISAYFLARHDNGSYKSWRWILKYIHVCIEPTGRWDIKLAEEFTKKEVSTIKMLFCNNVYGEVALNPGWKKYKELAVKAYDRWDRHK